jgi:mono/diheme cytochrome c family protein
VLFGVVKEGGAAFAPPGFRSNMPAFGEALSDREIWAVLAYIKSTWPPTVLAKQRQIDEAAR